MKEKLNQLVKEISKSKVSYIILILLIILCALVAIFLVRSRHDVDKPEQLSQEQVDNIKEETTEVKKEETPEDDRINFTVPDNHTSSEKDEAAKEEKEEDAIKEIIDIEPEKPEDKEIESSISNEDNNITYEIVGEIDPDTIKVVKEAPKKYIDDEEFEAELSIIENEQVLEKLMQDYDGVEIEKLEVDIEESETGEITGYFIEINNEQIYMENTYTDDSTDTSSDETDTSETEENTGTNEEDTPTNEPIIVNSPGGITTIE